MRRKEDIDFRSNLLNAADVNAPLMLLDNRLGNRKT